MSQHVLFALTIQILKVKLSLTLRCHCTCPCLPSVLDVYHSHHNFIEKATAKLKKRIKMRLMTYHGNQNQKNGRNTEGDWREMEALFKHLH